MKKWAISILLAIAIIFSLRLNLYNLCTNAWLLATSSNSYFIPRTSSIFYFHPIVMNDGSGDWWIYAEDKKYVYYLHPETIASYYLIEKAQLTKEGAIASKFETWPRDKIILQSLVLN